MPVNIQQMENEVAQVSAEFEAIDPLIIQYSTTNIIKQAPNVAESTFAISGSAYESERMPQSPPAQETPSQPMMTQTQTMRSGY